MSMFGSTAIYWETRDIAPSRVPTSLRIALGPDSKLFPGHRHDAAAGVPNARLHLPPTRATTTTTRSPPCRRHSRGQVQAVVISGPPRS